MVRDSVAKWLGIVSVIFGLISIGAGSDAIKNGEKASVGWGLLGFCFPMFLVVGILFYYYGMRAEKQRLDYEKLAGYLKAYRRIKIEALSQKLALSEYETERRILHCVRLGLLSGFIDRGSDEFFNPHGMEGRTLITCPNCGGSVEQMVLEGETGKCPYCQSVLRAEGPDQGGDLPQDTPGNIH
jgi:hypothetical protein